ncbi:MAG: helix-turn-helix transcriptional regulator, partial [Myxococcota bacterium]
ASRPNVLFLVLISDPDAKLPLQPDALRRLYRLTPAESRLCAALANGNTLKTYAEAEGVALETVRSQLKQAMVKTDTHKQAQLVRLLVTGPAAFTSM